MSDLKIPTELVASIFNPASYADRARMEGVLTNLRHNYPLSIAEVPGYDPHWIVTKYKDVREITRQDNIFHSGDRSKTPVSQIAEQMMRDYSGGKPHIFRTLVHMDPPDHTAHRDLIKDVFMPQNIATLEATVREMARRHVDKMAAMGTTCDFAGDVAMPYPLEVVCTLIGLPKEDHDIMLRLTQWFLSYADPDLCRPGSVLTDPEELRMLTATPSPHPKNSARPSKMSAPQDVIETRLWLDEHDWLYSLLHSEYNVSPTFRFPDLISACVSLVFTHQDASTRIFQFLGSELVLRSPQTPRRREAMWREQFQLLLDLQLSPANRHPNPKFQLDQLTTTCVALCKTWDASGSTILRQARRNMAARAHHRRETHSR